MCFHRRGEHRSPGLTPLPCRASPLKRRRFVKAASYRGGGTKCQRSSTPKGRTRFAPTEPFYIFPWVCGKGKLITADRYGHLSLQKYLKTKTIPNVQNPRPIVGANIVRPGYLETHQQANTIHPYKDTAKRMLFRKRDVQQPA